MTALRTFDSFDALVSAAKAARTTWTRHAVAHKRDEREWFGTRTFSEAIDIARKGWPEGRAKMVKGVAAAALIRKPMRHATLTMDVAGAYPIVPLACAGDPMNMVCPLPAEDSVRPIVRLWLPLFVSASYSPQQIINHGVALLSYIDAVEEQGYSVELTGVCTLVDNNTEGYIADIFVTLKHAGEHIDFDRLAFALAHPATFRRLMFAIMEEHPELERRLPYHSQYGRVPEHEIDRGVNYLPGLKYGEEHYWNTLDSAMKRMAELILPGIAGLKD